MPKVLLFSIISLFIFFHTLAEETASPIPEGIKVDLREPEYCEGVLKTDKGGVICGPDMRVQARKIVYTRKEVEGESVFTLEAEGDLLVEFGPYIFVGARLEYDFNTHSGFVYEGRTGQDPWFFGGNVIALHPDGNYTIYDGFITTSENKKVEWGIKAKEATLIDCQFLTAKEVKFEFWNVPVFYLPNFSADLDSIFDSPIRYYVRWGGHHGTRFGMIYEFFSWRRFKAFVRLDFSLKRGVGGGFETYYSSPDHRERFETINYVAQDTSEDNPHQKFRYRFQGVYTNKLYDDSLAIYATWDKLSDQDMPTDYNDRGLELDTAGRTQLHLRHEDNYRIINLYTLLRINNFQTLKQELPTFQSCWMPSNLSSYGIINQSQIKSSFLDFKYPNGTKNVHNYHSGRLEYMQKLYRPITWSVFTVTPEVSGTAIFYSNSESDKSKFLGIGGIGATLNTRLHRYIGNNKHVLVPYLKYQYLTFPTTSPDDHYIFDIDDGLYRLNMMTLGLQQNFYYKDCNGYINRFLYVDLYAHAFFNTKTIHSYLPKLYSDIIYNSTPWLRHTLNAAWDIQRSKLDHFNFRTEWTLSDDFAIAAEFRSRDAFAWRKVDYSNFILDSFRTVHELLDSQLSDRRDTFLVTYYYRINPTWAIQLESRQGWNRKHEKNYSEFEIDLLGTLRSAWHIKIYYRHREDDDRVAVNVSLGIRKPDASSCDCIVPCLEF